MLQRVKRDLLKIRKTNLISYSIYILKKVIVPKPALYNFHYIVSVMIQKIHAKNSSRS